MPFTPFPKSGKPPTGKPPKKPISRSPMKGGRC
jgi:hypothetical protein